MQNSSQWPCSMCPIPQFRLVAMRTSYIYFLIFPGHPEFWTPLQIHIWGPPGCTLFHYSFFHPSTAPNPGNHCLFTVSIVLPFLECHVVGWNHKVCSLFRLNSSFSNMNLNCLYIFLWHDNSFLCRAE